MLRWLPSLTSLRPKSCQNDLDGCILFQQQNVAIKQ
jgi:hypothetical protein